MKNITTTCSPHCLQTKSVAHPNLAQCSTFPLFAIILLTLSDFTFSVAVFAEAWEYDNKGEDNMVEDKYTNLVTN